MKLMCVDMESHLFRCFTKDTEATVSTEEFFNSCVNVTKFLDCCKACPNYNKIWSCPPYDFLPCDYWLSYKSLYILGRQIFITEKTISKIPSTHELKKFADGIIRNEKQKIREKLLKITYEEQNGTVLAAGSCDLCLPLECGRKSGFQCRKPKEMAYSIESLGGDVVLTAKKYLGLQIFWISNEDGAKFPPYLLLVGGILKK